MFNIKKEVVVMGEGAENLTPEQKRDREISRLQRYQVVGGGRPGDEENARRRKRLEELIQEKDKGNKK